MMHKAIAGQDGPDRMAPSRAVAAASAASSFLLCRVGTLLCGLPVGQVGAVMRALPIEPVAGMPSYVLGVAIIRGAPVPVVDLGLIIGGAGGRPQRLVAINTVRMVALAVDEVIGVAPVATDDGGQLPPLLQDAASDTIAGISVRDSRLLMFLRASRIVPEDILERLDSERMQ